MWSLRNSERPIIIFYVVIYEKETKQAQKTNMESGVGTMNHECKATSTITIKGILSLLMESVGENNDDNSKRVISLGMGDPTLSTCFPNAKVAEEAVADALCSGNFHGYAPTAGLLQARK